mgnify:CR=1 FL=1
MPALEILGGYVTAPSTTLTALTMGSGNSLTIRNAPFETDIRLIQAWAMNQTAGILRIRSPRLHDNVQGIRTRVPATTPRELLPRGHRQKLITQDDLIVEQSGSATTGDIEMAFLLIHYAELPGIMARMVAQAERARQGAAPKPQPNPWIVQ